MVPQSTVFQFCRDGSSWVEPVLKAKINVSCSRTQGSVDGEAGTRTYQSPVKQRAKIPGLADSDQTGEMPSEFSLSLVCVHK